jgi:hypothetical protein
MVLVTYCRPPTIDLKKVGSETQLEPNLVSLVLDAIGEAILFAFHVSLSQQIPYILG